TRTSADLSALLAYPSQAGYKGVDHLYLVDGNVVGLAVQDFNHDGRDDVIQLHRASGDFSVRLANPDGTLQAPVFYTVGNVPASQVFADANNDGIADQITANLGTTKVERGSVSVRLGNGNGTFGPEQRIQLPPTIKARCGTVKIKATCSRPLRSPCKPTMRPRERASAPARLSPQTVRAGNWT